MDPDHDVHLSVWWHPPNSLEGAEPSQIFLTYLKQLRSEKFRTRNCHGVRITITNVGEPDQVIEVTPVPLEEMPLLIWDREHIHAEVPFGLWPIAPPNPHCVPSAQRRYDSTQERDPRTDI